MSFARALFALGLSLVVAEETPSLRGPNVTPLTFFEKIIRLIRLINGFLTVFSQVHLLRTAPKWLVVALVASLLTSQSLGQDQTFAASTCGTGQTTAAVKIYPCFFSVFDAVAGVLWWQHPLSAPWQVTSVTTGFLFHGVALVFAQVLHLGNHQLRWI